MKKFFPYLILFSALLISITGSFFSIYGLGKLFGGHQLGATIIAFSFEFGNIVTASALKFYWKYLPAMLKYPLIVIVFALTILTSMGIYGYLSDGYQKTALKDEIVTRKSKLIELKRDNFQVRIEDFKKELNVVNNSIQELTKGLNTNSQTQQIVKGQLITNVQVTSKKSIDNQLNISNDRKLALNSKIESMQDSVQRLELEIIEMEANNENASELGPLKYLAELTGYPMNRIVNWLILLIVIVFQPLAIMLILTSMFAFKNNHYLTRSSRSKVKSNVPTLPFLTKLKEFGSKVKSKITKKPIPPPVPTPKPKRKVNRKPKVQTPTEIPTVPVEEPTIIIEPIEEPSIDPVVPAVPVNKPKRQATNRRKVVDTNLTPDLAEHIARSLPSKKKP